MVGGNATTGNDTLLTSCITGGQHEGIMLYLVAKVGGKKERRKETRKQGGN